MTLTPEQHDALSAKIREFGSIRFPAPYWFSEDADNVYCLECARLQEEAHPDWQRDGGWHTEDDSVLFCETCGTPLEHSLTDNGAEQELKYFEENGADLTDVLTRYTLATISGGYPLSHAERLYKVIFGSGD